MSPERYPYNVSCRQDWLDRYWEPPRYECTVCGAEESSNPERMALDEFMCPACYQKFLDEEKEE